MIAVTLQFLALTFAGSAAVASQFVPAGLCDEDEAISILGAVAIGAVLLMVGKIAV